MSAETKKSEYDPVTHRYHATCPHCGFVSIRAKREAAEHVLSQHVAYAHEASA